MKTQDVAVFQLWLADLHSGKLINHQPTRRIGHKKWYLIQLEKENRTPNN